MGVLIITLQSLGFGFDNKHDSYSFGYLGFFTALYLLATNWPRSHLFLKHYTNPSNLWFFFLMHLHSGYAYCISRGRGIEIPSVSPALFKPNWRQYPSPCRWKTLPQHAAAATSMLHCWDGIRQMINSAWFPPDMTHGTEASQFNLGFIRPRESCFSQS